MLYALLIDRLFKLHAAHTFQILSCETDSKKNSRRFGTRYQQTREQTPSGYIFTLNIVLEQLAHSIKAEVRQETLKQRLKQDSVGDSNSETAWTLRRLKDKTFTYLVRRTFDETYLRNNRKQSEQQTYPGGMPTEHHQHKHRQLDGGPHRLQMCQQRDP